MQHEHGTLSDLFILLSYFIAVIASYMSLDIVERIRNRKRRRQWFMLGFGAATMGIGMWSMHLVAMLSYTFSSPIAYNAPIAMLSVLIAIIASFSVLYIMSRKQFTRMKLIISTITLAVGISGMHYVGMAAMEMKITYNPIIVMFSILLSIAVILVALRLSYGTSEQDNSNSLWKKVGGSVILGMAIVGLHYTGMAAATFSPINADEGQSFTIRSELLEQLFTIGSIITLVLSIIGIHMSKQLLLSESKYEENKSWYKSLYDNNHDAIITVDLHTCIIDLNQAASSITGLSSEEVTGKPLKYMMGIVVDEEPDCLDSLMFKSLNEHEGEGCETAIVHRNGRRYEVRVKSIPVVIDGDLLGYYLLVKDITADSNARLKIQQMAYLDDLTGLPNRRMLKPILLDNINIFEVDRVPFSVMVLDIDRFKNINDSFGHALGDQFLIMVSERLKEALKAYDAIILRMGGDEFTIIISHADIKTISYELAEHIVGSLSKPFSLNRMELYTTASIGIAIYPQHGNNPEHLLKNADKAMYAVKKNGRNDYKLYTDDLEAHMLDRISLEADLRKAIKRDELSLHYQPQFNAYSHTIIGFEALLRWNHAKKGNIPPDQFIPIAEETGLICEIGEWVLKQACMQLKKWQVQFGLNIPVSVNLSTVQFYDDQLTNKVVQVLKDTGLSPDCLELEITESMMMDVKRATSTLHELKSIGVKISMDDFGTGYSSLHYLKRFPIERLKIDRSFIRDVTTDEQDRAIVATIISMAKHLKMRVIAEGVETEEQLNLLKVNGCMDIQGYYYSRPLPPTEIESQFLSNRPFV